MSQNLYLSSSPDALAGRSDVTQPLFLRIPDACVLLQVSRSSLYRLIDSGQIMPVKIGKLTRISRAELERFAESLAAPR